MIKENEMNNTLTVAQLIETLQGYDPNLPVRLSVNMEYDVDVESHMIGVDDGVLVIDDCRDLF